MKRLLIASTILLAAALAFLLYQRFKAPPPSPPAPPPAAAAAQAQAEPPKAVEPAPASARPDEAKPAEAPASPAAAASGPAVARPVPEARTRKKAEATAPDAAAAAIFSDRPAGDGDGSRQKTPRIPVLRKPPAGVAPAAHATAVVRPPAPRAGAGRASAAPAPPPAQAGPPLVAAASPAAPPPDEQASPALGLTGAVAGTLRGTAGEPVAGFSVLALAATADDAFQTVTDDEGFFLLSGLRPGRYLLFAGLGTQPAPSLPARAAVVQHGRVTRLDLRVPAGGGTVRVRPLGADGRPLPGQALLLAIAPPSPASFAALLRSDAVFLPEPGDQRLLRRVPAGVYTLVLLQADATLRVARQPVAVRGDGEQLLEVRFPADGAGAPGG